MTELNLPDIKITNDGVKALAKFVKNNLPRLKEIHLSSNYLVSGQYRGVLRRALRARQVTFPSMPAVTLDM